MDVEQQRAFRPVDGPLDGLTSAVRQSTSWRGVCRVLGLRSSSAQVISCLRRRCDDAGIDYGHFTHARRWTDDELRQAYAACTSWTQLLEALGYTSGSGSARSTVRRHLIRLGLDARRIKEPGAGGVPSAPCGAPDARRLRDAGALLVAGMLTLCGYRVSWPLEPAPYDLLLDGNHSLQRVQVKSTTRRQGGTWVCNLSRSEYAADAPSGRRRSHYGPDDVDAFGVVDGDLSVYLIPRSVVSGLSAIHVRAYDDYRVDRLAPRPV